MCCVPFSHIHRWESSLTNNVGALLLVRLIPFVFLFRLAAPVPGSRSVIPMQFERVLNAAMDRSFLCFILRSSFSSRTPQIRNEFSYIPTTPLTRFQGIGSHTSELRATLLAFSTSFEVSPTGHIFWTSWCSLMQFDATAGAILCLPLLCSIPSNAVQVLR